MVLKILREKEENLTDMCLTPDEFADPAYHPFIATTKFDKVIVELGDGIPNGYISQILLKGNKIIPKINSVDGTVVSQLCEIYPDKRAELRFTYLRKKDDFFKLLNKLEEDYNWKQELMC